MKTSELHYRITNQEWRQMKRELTYTESDLLMHLRTLDPFGDRPMSMSVRGLAKDLECSPSSISRALKTLDRLGYIDLELINVQVRVHSHGTPLRGCNTRSSDDETKALMAQQTHECNDKAPEPRTQEAFKTPHTLSYYSDFKNSLSEEPIKSERENLESSLNQPSQEDEPLIEWIGKQNKTARNPRAYALKCLNTDRPYWDETYRQSQESKERAIVPAAARPVEKAFVDMNPQEQAEYRATIAQNRPRSGGNPAFTQVLDIIAQAAINPTP